MIEGESEVAGLAESCHTSAQCTPRPDGVQVARPQIIFSIHIQSYLVVKTLNTRPLTALCLSRSVQSPCLKVSSLTTFSTLNKVCEEQQLTCIVYVKFQLADEVCSLLTLPPSDQINIFYLSFFY